MTSPYTSAEGSCMCTHVVRLKLYTVYTPTVHIGRTHVQTRIECSCCNIGERSITAMQFGIPGHSVMHLPQSHGGRVGGEARCC